MKKYQVLSYGTLLGTYVADDAQAARDACAVAAGYENEVDLEDRQGGRSGYVADLVEWTPESEREEIIKSLTLYGSSNDRADYERICDRMEQCNVRLVRVDGTVEAANGSPRGPHRAADMMLADASIDRFEYDFNGEWHVAR